MTKVYPQTCLKELPYCVWTLLNKSTGKVNTSDYHCIAGYGLLGMISNFN